MANDIKPNMNTNLTGSLDRLLDKQVENQQQNQVVLYNDVQQVDLKGKTTIDGLPSDYGIDGLSFKEAMRLDQPPPTHAELEPPSVHFVLYAFGDQTKRKMRFQKLTRDQKNKTNQLLQKINQSAAGTGNLQHKAIGSLEKEARMLNLVDHLLDIQDLILARMGSQTKG